MNPRRAPRWVFRNHAEDEFAEFNANSLPARANWMSREPAPIQLEAGPVPSHYGLRLNENQCLPAPGPEAPQYRQAASSGHNGPASQHRPGRSPVTVRDRPQLTNVGHDYFMAKLLQLFADPDRVVFQPPSPRVRGGHL